MNLNDEKIKTIVNKGSSLIVKDKEQKIRFFVVRELFINDFDFAGIFIDPKYIEGYESVQDYEDNNFFIKSETVSPSNEYFRIKIEEDFSAKMLCKKDKNASENSDSWRNLDGNQFKAIISNLNKRTVQKVKDEKNWDKAIKNNELDEDDYLTIQENEFNSEGDSAIIKDEIKKSHYYFWETPEAKKFLVENGKINGISEDEIEF